ncbi:DUF6387 family protein [Dechloromonas sp. TW-R-39-2]|uniref:DUF6387 family protein n=1 Tax=Dechloromonas sp. TW-R-39-2 TaxID=2654218 RepID=UPI00193D4E52|nr:DUF6387 family protein [Dechloromonas sp. TW-R-39-2]
MAKIQSNLLTDIQLRKWVRAGLPVAKSDGAGLTFTLSAAGAATWVLRYQHGGRRQEVTLGRYPDVSLAAARLNATKKRLALIDGVNPADEVRKTKAHKDWTVRELIKDYRELVLTNLADSTQRSYGRNLKRIENGMGAMSVQSVGPADVVAQIERVKTGWVELFTLWCVLLGIFKHATGKKLIFASPCAGIQLEAIIGKRPEIKKRLMLSAEELAVLMNAHMKPDNLLSVKILLATGVRISELFTALRENVFITEARWHIPQSKTGPAMDIPLVPCVIEWFKELFELAGNSVYVLPARLRTWVQRMEDTEKHGDLVLDGDLEFDEEICRNVHEYLSSPAWKIHRDSLGQVKRFFIGVDLNASDDYLVKQFRSWIAKTRAEADIEPKQWLFSDKRFEKWHKDRLLPYLDLTFWATINHKKIKPADMEEILFQGKFDGFPGENVTKKIAKEAVKLISDATLYALNVELRTYECVMSGKS